MGKVIRVENLGKKFVIQHENQAKYSTLRDTVAESAVKIGNRFFRKGIKGAAVEPRREDFWALQDVSFEVEQGEKVGIIGRNGAGKTTLLKILSRITEPTTGRAAIRGRVSSLLEVGTGFHAELTGRENIYLNGAILGMTRTDINRKFDEIVAFAEVDKFLDTPVKRYSSGMSVRLAFAVAAHLEPEILLVDEVLAVGDVQFQKKCLGKMEEVSKKGRTVFFVTHNMAAIQVLCSRIIRFDAGRIAGQGDVSEQVQLYLNSVQCQPGSGGGPVMLGPDLELHRLDFNPNPVMTGTDLQFQIHFESARPIKLEELVMLFYTAHGMRIAHLELRKKGEPYWFGAGKRSLCLSGTVEKLPFVEGTYQVGLFINYERAAGDFLNLAEFRVQTNPGRFDFVPYPAASRGVVEIDACLHC